MAKSCGNCMFFSTYFCSGACTNPDSKHLGEFVSRSDYCRNWKKECKEGRNSDGGRTKI